ncbi:hypothetical protein C0992_012374 [Termitomyces sp. T32_za158]|nr:hypothetical protein C0992_012374 [Termitomyces sp. T32_za158]
MVRKKLDLSGGTLVQRAVWTNEEDAILCWSLVAEKDARNQSEAGWKKTVWTAVAAALAKAVKDKEIVLKGPAKEAGKCSKHWNHLKKMFNQVDFVCNCSGMGWDEGRKICATPDHIWQELFHKTVQRAAHWRITPFPCYDEMHYLVFGTVATGAGAFHPGETPVTSPYHLPSSPHGFSELNENSQTQEVTVPATAELSDPPQSGGHGGILTDEVAQELTNSQQVGFILVTMPVKYLLSPHQTPGPKKHVQADSDSPRPTTSTKKIRRGRFNGKGSNSELATALREVAVAMTGNPETPQHHSKAIDVLYDDGDFSDGEEISILCLFTHNKAIVDIYSSIKNKEKHTKYLCSMLADSN